MTPKHSYRGLLPLEKKYDPITHNQERNSLYAKTQLHTHRKSSQKTPNFFLNRTHFRQFEGESGSCHFDSDGTKRQFRLHTQL